MRKIAFIPIEFILPEEFNIVLKDIGGGQFELTYQEFITGLDEAEAQQVVENTRMMLKQIIGSVEGVEIVEQKVEPTVMAMKIRGPIDTLCRIVLSEMLIRAFTYRSEVVAHLEKVSSLFPDDSWRPSDGA